VQGIFAVPAVPAPTPDSLYAAWSLSKALDRRFEELGVLDVGEVVGRGQERVLGAQDLAGEQPREVFRDRVVLAVAMGTSMPPPTERPWLMTDVAQTYFLRTSAPIQLT
jgi:hypothetical protein